MVMDTKWHDNVFRNMQTRDEGLESAILLLCTRECIKIYALSKVLSM